MKRSILGVCGLLLVLIAGAAADEGMWLLNQPPREQLKKKYNFDVTEAWLDHLRFGSVRFNNGGSGSFVSADGLAFTNHHVGRECLQQLSTAQNDYIKNGFYAKTQADEGKCPDLELNQLVGIDDVTAAVQAAAQPGMSDAAAGLAERQKMAELEKQCNAASGLRCDVVTLYAGGMYNLYKYKKYTDVRVVFAPEAQMAFFGGDHDNFEYPRYDLDITFFRVYENGKPAHLTDYLHWSPSGIKLGDLVFVSGHPGTTQRLLTMDELYFLRDVQTDAVIQRLTARNSVLHDFAVQSPENARLAASSIFSVENSLKAYKGRRFGLHDADLMAGKAAAEKKLRAAVEADPKLKAQYGSAWDEVAKSVEARRQLLQPYTFIESLQGFQGDTLRLARTLVRVSAEKSKPNGERLREYSDSRLPSLEQSLLSAAPVYRGLDTATLAGSLTLMRDTLGASDPTVVRALQGHTPTEAAKAYINGTHLDDPAVRQQLYDGGAKAIAASTDPLIVLMRDIDTRARQLRQQWDDQVESVERINSTRIAQARFAVDGTGSYPDATFTLRLSYGTVKGFKQETRFVPPYTSLGQTYAYAAQHGNRGDFQLPASWLENKSKLRLSTPFNFIHTADIIGGNSGSPTVNRQGEIVGIIFDGNLQSLPWDFAYDDRQGRALSVDSRAILETLRGIYHATALVDELTHGQQPADH